ncbi:MAG: nucleoside deaminase [Planctomycetota bacterium]
MPDPELMREAIRLAHDHMQAGHGGPFGALIVDAQGEVIARGWNQVTTQGDPTAHAEVVAIREACQKVGHFELRGCTLYTSCEPCPMCLGATYWARIERVYFAADRHQAAAAGFSDAVIYEELELPAEGRTRLPMERLLADESQAPFDAWTKKSDKIEY